MLMTHEEFNVSANSLAIKSVSVLIDKCVYEFTKGELIRIRDRLCNSEGNAEDADYINKMGKYLNVDIPEIVLPGATSSQQPPVITSELYQSSDKGAVAIEGVSCAICTFTINELQDAILKEGGATDKGRNAALELSRRIVAKPEINRVRVSNEVDAMSPDRLIRELTGAIRRADTARMDEVASAIGMRSDAEWLPDAPASEYNGWRAPSTNSRGNNTSMNIHCSGATEEIQKVKSRFIIVFCGIAGAIGFGIMAILYRQVWGFIISPFDNYTKLIIDLCIIIAVASFYIIRYLKKEH